MTKPAPYKPIQSGPRYAKPGDTIRFPWRFPLETRVYVLGQLFSDPFTVVDGELWMGMPHYHLRDRDGVTWRVPQLWVSSKPIEAR